MMERRRRRRRGVGVGHGMDMTHSPSINKWPTLSRGQEEKKRQDFFLEGKTAFIKEMGNNVFAFMDIPFSFSFFPPCSRQRKWRGGRGDHIVFSSTRTPPPPSGIFIGFEELFGDEGIR